MSNKKSDLEIINHTDLNYDLFIKNNDPEILAYFNDLKSLKDNLNRVLEQSADLIDDDLSIE